MDKSPDKHWRLQAIVDRLAANGYGLVGGIGQYENTWLMALSVDVSSGWS